MYDCMFDVFVWFTEEIYLKNYSKSSGFVINSQS